MPEPSWGRATRWLTALTIDPDSFGADRELVRVRLEEANIEARPVWKPMHLQRVFRAFPSIRGRVAEDLFERGICLPSGSSLKPDQQSDVIDLVRQVCPLA